jgi:hypothetical protein
VANNGELPSPHVETRANLLAQHAALARNLRRLGVLPLVDTDAAEALEVDDLRDAVRAEGRHLVTVSRALGGS